MRGIVLAAAFIIAAPATAGADWPFAQPRAGLEYARDHVIVLFRRDVLASRLGRLRGVEPQKAVAALGLPPGVELVETPLARWRRRHAGATAAPAGSARAVIDLDRRVYARVPPGMTATGLVALLRANPAVAYAEPDYVGHGATTIPNDPEFSSQWQHRNLYCTSPVPADIRTVEAWDICRGDSNVVLAVLDTGLNTNLLEFSGRTVPGYDFANSDDDPADDHDHGTAVAGTAAATGNNSNQLAGVDWYCRIMPVKVLNSANWGYYSWWADGIEWAVSNGADVINLSAGGSSSDTTLSNAIMDAVSRGVIFITITHNDGSSTIRFPGSMRTCITVGGTTTNDSRATWSNYGPEIDLVAPAENIRVILRDGSLSDWYGTSFAAPLVAGVACLVRALQPDVDQRQMEQLLRATADDQVGDPAEDTLGFDVYHGSGRLNAFQALLRATNIGDEVWLTPYTVDGDLTLLEESLLRVENNGMHLYADFNGRVLYVATEDAGEGNDHFIFVTDDPSGMSNAPWAKSGRVAGLRHYLADENDNDFAGWYLDGVLATGQAACAPAVNGGVLEGTLDLVEAFGYIPTNLYIAVGPYETADGGALVPGSQVPAGDGDGDIESNEYYVLDMTSFDTDGDGLPDLDEDIDADGVMDPGETGARVADSDHDGLDDGKEISWGSDPLDPDSDDDGMLDGHEYIAGTDPLDPFDNFTAHAVIEPGITTTGGVSGKPHVFLLKWRSHTGRVYSVHRFDGPLGTGIVWTSTTFSNVPGNGESMEYSEPITENSPPLRHFRLKVRLAQ